MATNILMTADELLALPADGLRHELIEGEITTMTPAGSEHGRIAARLLIRVGGYVEQHSVGSTYAAETGFRLGDEPDTVRAPDLAVVAKDRRAEVDVSRGYGRGAPDLVAEVISPNDRYEDVDLKVRQWLRAGSRIVWVVNPRTRTVTAYTPDGHAVVREAEDTLDGGDVLPGFACSVAELFV